MKPNQNKQPVDAGLIDSEGKKRLRKAGSGKITIDSGAGESVCPISLVPEEPIHETSKNGACYKVACGQTLINQGEKRIKFRAGQHIGKLHFQAIAEVKNPLASAAKIANKGNLIVLDEDGGESYIYNKATKKSIPIHQENNVYVLDVSYMSEIDSASKSAEVPFRRPE